MVGRGPDMGRTWAVPFLPGKGGGASSTPRCSGDRTLAANKLLQRYSPLRKNGEVLYSTIQRQSWDVHSLTYLKGYLTLCEPYSALVCNIFPYFPHKAVGVGCRVGVVWRRRNGTVPFLFPFWHREKWPCPRPVRVRSASAFVSRGWD
eukprot:gene23183-biopygen16328